MRGNEVEMKRTRGIRVLDIAGEFYTCLYLKLRNSLVKRVGSEGRGKKNLLECELGAVFYKRMGETYQKLREKRRYKEKMMKPYWEDQKRTNEKGNCSEEPDADIASNRCKGTFHSTC